MDDTSDLAAWVQRRDDAAFARLVERHSALVAGVCRHQLRDHRADEAVQAVFIVLARRAGSVSDPAHLGTWLYSVAIRVCREAQRTAARRAIHEHRAAQLPRPEPEVGWNELRPHLDEAIAALSTSQREAVIGHFLEGLPQAAVAERLGISEDAAHQRIHYALGKLRTWFGKRGMAVGAGVLAAGLASEAGAVEPALVAACTQAAVHPVATSAASVLAGGALAAGAAKVAAALAVLAMAAGGVVAWRALTPASVPAPIRSTPAPVVAAPLIVPARTESVLLAEDFEDDAFRSRGWYGNTGFILSSAEHAPGGARAAEFRFLTGAQMPVSGGASRRLFTPATAITVSYRIKYGPRWADPGIECCQIQLMTTADDRWADPSYTHLTCAIGVEQGTPYISIQDPRNLAIDRIGQDLTAVTEDRAVHGGNGGATCFKRADGRYWNGDKSMIPAATLTEGAGPQRMGEWHRIDVRFRLNSIVNGRGVADGSLTYLVDGHVVLERSAFLYRTAQHADMRFNQILVGPWFGGGFPSEQTFWLDDLTVSTDADAAKAPSDF